MLTQTETAEDAAAKLAGAIDLVVLVLDAPEVLAVADGRRVEVPDFDAGAIVDPTGDRDLLCAAYAWARLRGAGVEDGAAWAQLYSRLAMTRADRDARGVDARRGCWRRARRGG